MDRLRNIVFTWNNYDEAALEAVREFADTCSYIVVGKEVGECGTPHPARHWAEMTKPGGRVVFLLVKKTIFVISGPQWGVDAGSLENIGAYWHNTQHYAHIAPSVQ